MTFKKLLLAGFLLFSASFAGAANPFNVSDSLDRSLKEGLHELYNLLQRHFESFSTADKGATLKAIQEIPLPKAGDDPKLVLRLIQRNWMSAIANKGYEPANAWYRELSSDPELGGLREHPEFHSYMQSAWGPGPTPYQPPQLVAFAQEGTLIEKLNGFTPSSQWRGPNKRALTDAL